MKEFPHLPPEIGAALDDYEERLASGELKFDAKGDIVPDGPELPGWMMFLVSKLPPDNFAVKHGSKLFTGKKPDRVLP